MPAASTGCIATRSTPTCGWSSRPSSRRRSSAAIPDNFTYPRYDLDMALFRVYENGQPVQSKHYLKWSAKGAGRGRPGLRLRASRLDRSAEDGRAARVPARRAVPDLARDDRAPSGGAARVRQARPGAGAPDDGLRVRPRELAEGAFGRSEGAGRSADLRRKKKEERRLPAPHRTQPEWKAAYGSPWDDIAKAQEQRAASSIRRSASARCADRAWPARRSTIARYVQEIAKPDAERLDGFHDAQLESLKLSLLSPAPQYPERDIAVLADALQQSLDALGPNDPFIKAALGGKTPDGRRAGHARRHEAGRSGGPQGAGRGGASRPSRRPPIRSSCSRARSSRSSARPRRRFEDEVESVEAAAGEKLGRARFAAYGKSAYPDATFTLRLAFGTVKGYPMNGTMAPPVTTFYGLYDRAESFVRKPPYDLPARYYTRRAQAEPRDAAQLRLRLRHHRRQLGIAGRQSPGRARRPRSSTATSRA